MSHPRPKGRSSTRTVSFSPSFQGLLISSKFRSDVSIPPGLAVGCVSMMSPEKLVLSVMYCRMAGSVAVKAITYPPASRISLDILKRRGNRGNASTLREFVPTPGSKNLVQMFHVCRVGRTLLLIARQRRYRRLGITSAVRVAASSKHCKGGSCGTGDCEASSGCEHETSSTSGRENLPGSTHPKCIAHRDEPLMISHPRPKGLSSTRAPSLNPALQGRLISSKFRSDS